MHAVDYADHLAVQRRDRPKIFDEPLDVEAGIGMRHQNILRDVEAPAAAFPARAKGRLTGGREEIKS
ncbi:hypothetical protein AHIS1636_04510 [Arthrobacter mangrovi]|uniref:Uncharacterized protein n=1 Tax=Arthrobacter mangrovi TaxID=2966350 RepID=A0ABQ5MPV1_9MICC|nr:hypothetical protein AHIS1636_04510 [Arthrobacter mangrovi]